MPTIEIRRTSRLAAPAEEVWAFAISEAGLAHEFGPWMRMTIPRGLRGRTIADVPVGEPLGRSWLLFARFLPFDYDDLTLAEIGPGRRFLEHSKLGSARSWQHERLVAETGEGACELTDALTLVPRAPITALRLEWLASTIVGAVFDHRHRRLRERWGSAV